jgi:hypothetical protein
MDLEEKMKNYNNDKMSTKNKVNYPLALAALAVLSIFTGTVFNRDKLDQKDSLAKNNKTIVEERNENIKTGDGYYIPKIQIHSILSRIYTHY